MNESAIVNLETPQTYYRSSCFIETINYTKSGANISKLIAIEAHREGLIINHGDETKKK
jgi:hypothetical protein